MSTPSRRAIDERTDATLSASPLDFTGLDDVLGQRGQTGLIARRQADVGQAPNQAALRPADLRHGRGQYRQVKTPLRPVLGLPDIHVIAAIHAVIISRFHRKRRIFTAEIAVKRRVIYRACWRLVSE